MAPSPLPSVRHMLLAATLLWSTPAAAMLDLGAGMSDEDLLAAVYGGEEVVSIATGSSKPLHKTPAVASVITADDIRAHGLMTLDEALARVPGLHLGISSTSRVNPVYSIRGIHTGYNPQVLVLMNGLPFPHLFSGGRPETFSLPLENVARIEVIRGPGSALYGADAFAGVVNIITKSADDLNGTHMGIRGGSFDTAHAWFQHGAGYGNWDLALSLEWNKSKGDNGRIVTEDLQTALDRANNTNFSLAPGPLETEYNIVNGHFEAHKAHWTFRLWGWLQEDGGMGAGAAQALDPVGKQDIGMYLVDVLYNRPHWIGAWDLQARLNHYDQTDSSHFQIFPNNVVGIPATDDTITGTELIFLNSSWTGHRLRLGGGYRYMDEITKEQKNFGPGVVAGVLTDVSNTPNVFLKSNSRKLWYLLAQDEWTLSPDWELTAGVRYDRYSDVGGTVNPRLALVWSTLYNLTTKFLYGRAFRAPSFSELHMVNNPAVLGNSSLEPETIETYEVAFDYRPTLTLQTNLNLFHYRVEDLIDYVRDAGATTSTAQNAKQQRGHGLELEVIWEAREDLTLQGSYAFQHSKEIHPTARVADAPAHKVRLDALWRFLPEWSVNPELVWVGDRPRVQGDPRAKPNDYALVNLNLRRTHIMNNWEAALLVRNLFNADARESSPTEIPNDYPLTGLAIYGELRYTFDAP